jgi:lysophospholipase L1-like esterase
VGDSIGWQSRPEIESAVSQTHRVSTFNSILGATVEYQTAATHEVVLGPDSPDILLVELGTNDTGKVEPAQFADDVRRFLDGVTPHVECVRWFDLKRGGSSVYQTFNDNAVLYNAILAEVIEGYPTVRLASYSTWAQLNGSAAFDIDGVHLSPRGERGLGQLASRAAGLCETDIDLRSQPTLTAADRV